MDSIYFKDPLGLLIELASYRFEPPRGRTHADVLLEAHRLRVERGDYNIDRGPPADAIEALVDAIPGDPVRGPRAEGPVHLERRIPMATHTLSAQAERQQPHRADLRAHRRAGLRGGGHVGHGTPEFLAKDPAHLTPMLEHGGLPRGTLWESCAIMAYLCNKNGLDHLYPTDPGERAMVDSAMFYVVGTLYPLITRATYPTLGFPQYPGEVGTSEANEALKAQAQKDAEAAIAEPLEAFRALPGRPDLHRRRRSVHRRHPPGRLTGVPRRHRLRLPRVDPRVHGRRRVRARGRLLRAGRGRARVRDLSQVTGAAGGALPSHPASRCAASPAARRSSTHSNRSLLCLIILLRM